MFLNSLGFLACVLLGLTGALELRGTEEGACLQDVPFHEDVNPAWFDTLPYINGGNKYHLYRQASVNPQFRQMREFEFYYEACFVKNASIIGEAGSAFGFGQILGSFDFAPEVDRVPGVIIATPNNEQTGLRTDILTLRTVLTDYRTFALMLTCWEGANQRGWVVYSRLPELDEATQNLIEDRVLALGFRRENVIFLRYGNCGPIDVDLILNPENVPSPVLGGDPTPWGNQDGSGTVPPVGGSRQQSGRWNQKNRNLRRNVVSPVPRTVSSPPAPRTVTSPPVATWSPPTGKGNMMSGSAMGGNMLKPGNFGGGPVGGGAGWSRR